METFVETLSSWRTGIMVVHMVGLALGVGGATVSDFLFFRFLKDLKISHFESKTLDYISKIIWFGLVVLIASGIGLYLPKMDALNESSKFLTKMLVVAVIAINGIVLNTFVSPKLEKISFEKRHEHVSGELRRLRKIAFALGSVSFISWYSALILGALRSIPYSLPMAVAGYALLLGIGVTGSQIAEYLLSKRKIRL